VPIRENPKSRASEVTATHDRSAILRISEEECPS
jgi:hypothetical protein